MLVSYGGQRRSRNMKRQLNVLHHSRPDLTNQRKAEGRPFCELFFPF